MTTNVAYFIPSADLALMTALEATVLELADDRDECSDLLQDLCEALTISDYLDVLEYALGDLDEDEVDADIRVLGDEVYSFIRED